MELPTAILYDLKRCTLKQAGMPHAKLAEWRWLWVPGKVENKKSQYRRLKNGGMFLKPAVVKAIHRVTACARYAFPGHRPDAEHHFCVLVVWLRPGNLLPKKSKVRALTRGDPCSSHDLIVDALQGIWWKNDSQIVELHDAELSGAVEEGQFIIARTLESPPTVSDLVSGAWVPSV